MEDGKQYLCEICLNGEFHYYRVGTWHRYAFEFPNGSYSNSRLYKKNEYKDKGNAYHVGRFLLIDDNWFDEFPDTEWEGAL